MLCYKQITSNPSLQTGGEELVESHETQNYDNFRIVKMKIIIITYHTYLL